MKQFLVLLLTTFSFCSFSQYVVTGTVIDGIYGGGLPGANVVIKGTEKGTSTDLDGNYTITVSDTNSILVFSFAGYETIEIGLTKKFVDTTGRYIVDLTLKQAKKQIEEVVKVGYGVQKKTDVTCKPVIYLYPPKATNISLTVDYPGTLKTTYPPYRTGWNVLAQPDGTLTDKADGREYSYLFWNGETRYPDDHLTYDNGFVVGTDTAMVFLQKSLSKLGFTAREYNDLIVYWLPYMQKAKLNFVHFLVGADYNSISTNNVNPKPDSELRVFIEFKAVDTVFSVEPQVFPSTFVRKGFTLVEWGGSEILRPVKVKNVGGTYEAR